MFIFIGLLSHYYSYKTTIYLVRFCLKYFCFYLGDFLRQHKNSADDYTRGYMPSRAMVEFNGDVFWPPPTKFRSTCGVDVTYFPFDDQTCTLKLGSWTYNGYQVYEWIWEYKIYLIYNIFALSLLMILVLLKWKDLVVSPDFFTQAKKCMHECSQFISSKSYFLNQICPFINLYTIHHHYQYLKLKYDRNV